MYFRQYIQLKLIKSAWVPYCHMQPSSISAKKHSPPCHGMLLCPREICTKCFIYLFIYLALPTRAGSPQQHMPITVGPFCLTHPVNFPCGRKPEYPEETHDFRQSVDFYSFHMGTGFESHWESSYWDLNLRPQRWKASAVTTWPPKPPMFWKTCEQHLTGW
jgi:hypothetical protein